MPVVTVLALPPDDPGRIETVLAGVVSDLATALETVPSNVWAHFVPMAALREGNAAPEQLEYHPIVTVLANPRPEEMISRGLKAVAGAVASGLGVKLEDVWVHWVDLPQGRVFGGGQVR